MLGKAIFGETDNPPASSFRPFDSKSSSTAKTYKSRSDKNRLKEELTVMLLTDDGSSDLYSMTRPDILEVSKEAARRLSTLPFGEMKMKDLRMLDPNVSFGSEPKILVRTLCALISLNPIHAFVLPDKVLMIVPDGADGILRAITSGLRAILQSSEEQDSDLASRADDGQQHQEQLNEIQEEQPVVDTAAQQPHSQQENGGPQDEVIPVAQPANAAILPTVEPDNSDAPARPDSTAREDAAHLVQDGGSPHHLHRTPFRSSRQLSFGSDRQRTSLRLEHKTLLRTRSYDSRDETPFQFVALELLFDAAAISFKKEVDYLKLARDEVKSMIKANELFTKVNALRSKVVSTRDTIEDFMSNDKDLGLFSFNSITRYYSVTGDNDNPAQVDAWEPYEMDVNEVQDLAEDFVSRLDDAVNEIDMLKFTVEEILLNLRHLSNERRESLMRMHVRIQGCTCLAAPPTLVAGLFGMNLTSGLETEFDTHSFWVTFGFCMGGFLILATLFVVFSDYLFGIQEMNGEEPD